MGKAKQDTPIAYHGFKPGQRVDVLFLRDGIKHWVKGYFVLDLLISIRSAKGEGKRALKPKQLKRLVDHIPVCSSPDGRCIMYHWSRVRLPKRDAVTFCDVFGSSVEGGIVFSGLTYDETEDLTLGLDVVEELEE